ncbi:MAG: alpha/beta hydrolase family esterase [Actinomycetes bacterium]
MPARRSRRTAAAALALVAALLVGLLGCSSEQSASTSTTTRVLRAADVVAAPSSGCGAATTAPVPTFGAPGRTKVLVDRPDGSRWSYLSAPPADDGQTPLPLVLDLHGYSEGADVHLQFTKMAELGNRAGFFTVTPQGSGATAFWNSFGQPAPDDVAFLTALVDRVAATHCVDLRRVYVDGMSNGAFMTSLLICRRPDVFAAGVAVAGLQMPEGCRSGTPVPVMAMHGTDDNFVRYEGGFGDGVRTLGVDPNVASTAGRNMSVPDAAEGWAVRNGCRVDPTTKKVAADVELLDWPGCRATTELYVVAGGGHSWPGSAFSKNISDIVGATTESIDATELAWRFFAAHPKSGAVAPR